MKPNRRVESQNYTIRSAGVADRAAIRNLFKLCLGSERSREFWEWKHVENPFGETFWLVAEAEGTVVGARAFMQWYWCTEARWYRAVRAVDTATHPDWRRQGIFTNLTTVLVDDVREAGVDFIFNTPNQFSRPGYLKMGWKMVERVPIWVKPLRPLRIATKVVGGTSETEYPIELAGSNVEDWLDEMAVEDVTRLATGGERRMHTDRSRAYFRWRYADIPGINYRVLWSIDGEVSAFVVYRKRRRGGLVELMLSEVMATPGCAGVRSLRKLLLGLAKESDADYMIGCAARKTTEMCAFGLSGFILAPKVGPSLVVRPLSSAAGAEGLQKWASWRCGIGELEIF